MFDLIVDQHICRPAYYFFTFIEAQKIFEIINQFLLEVTFC